MLKGETRIKEIDTKLAWLAQYVKFNNKQGMTDVNKAVENFFCGLLNIMFHASLENMNYYERDYPAVDLGDEEAGLAVQVTSTSSRDKIIHTLDKFFEHNLDAKFNRLIVLIVGKKEPYRKKFQTKRNYPFDKERDIWDIDRLGEEIDQLEEDEQNAIIRYLDQQMQLPWELPQKHVPAESEPQPLSGEKKLKYELPTTLGFIGREKELAELTYRLQEKNDKLFFITGLGGMGKTELAVRFGQNQRKQYKVHFARFVGSFRQTVSQSIAMGVENLWLKESRPEEQIYNEVMRVLEDCGDDTILIIDNADPPDDQNFDLLRDDTFEKLCAMKLRLVITTRAPVPGGVKARRMNDDELREIIGKYAEISREDADALIAAVDGHTLTIDLMARAMKPGWKRVTPATLLDALHKNTLSTTIGKTVFSDYSRDGKQAREQKKIYDHLRTVFNVADIPENAKQAMRCATLLPEAGMDADLFCEALPPAAQEALEELAARAWLRVDIDNKATIHPVVRLICFEELKPTDEICRTFLENLWGKYDKKQYDLDLYNTMAEVYTTAAEKLENERGGWSGRGRALWQKVGQYEKALSCAKMTLEQRKASLPADDPDLADAYNDMGLVYQGLRDHQGMAEYFGKALEIRQRVLDVDHVDLAKSYNNMGVAFEEKGDYQRALIHKLQALTIFEKILPEDDLDLATSCHHVGGTYMMLGDYRRALEYFERTLEIQQKVLPADHPNIADSYHNIALTYYRMRDHRSALEYQEKALEIQRNVLPANHPDIALSYSNSGNIYRNLGDYLRALEYQERALEIQLKAFPNDRPDTATFYSNLGNIYIDLGDHRRALEYCEQALEILQKVLPNDHPDIANLYHNMGCIYGNLKNYPLAVKYLEMALRISESKLPPGHPDTKNTREWLNHYRQKLENQHPSWMDQIQ